jgi:hypothetical protein
VRATLSVKPTIPPLPEQEVPISGGLRSACFSPEKVDLRYLALILRAPLVGPGRLAAFGKTLGFGQITGVAKRLRSEAVGSARCDGKPPSGIACSLRASGTVTADGNHSIRGDALDRIHRHLLAREISVADHSLGNGGGSHGRAQRGVEDSVVEDEFDDA